MVTPQEAIFASLMNVSLDTSGSLYLPLNSGSEHIVIASVTGIFVYNDDTSKLTSSSRTHNKKNFQR